MTYPPIIVQVLMALLVIPAAFFDLRERRVPNWLSLAGVLSGLSLNWFLYETPWFGLKGLGLAMLIYFPLYLLRGMGAGDVKLMAALGSIVGAANWLGILVLTSIFGAIAAIVLVTSRGKVAKTIDNLRIILLSARYGQAPYHENPQLDVRSSQATRLPHAVVIAFGTLGFLIAATIWAPR